jgi:YegS/Rv2252/BmrU family lipid kinase
VRNARAEGEAPEKQRSWQHYTAPPACSKHCAAMIDDTLPKQAVLIVNAMSRSGGDVFEEARRLLEERGVELISSHAVTDPEQMRPTVCKALDDKAPMIIVGGGDGSLSKAIDDFLGTETVFALLPLGTANSFAKTLGIGTDLAAAVETIASGRKMRIDLGAIDGDYFANAAAMGLSPLIAETVPHGLKRTLGMLGYMIWAVRVAFKFRPFRLRITEGKRVHKMWATEARIANGSHHGGVELVESADLQSGEIVVQAVTGKSLIHLAWSWFATIFKLRSRGETVTEIRGKELRIEARPRQKISIDGELSAKTPVTVTVARAAIWVAAPREEAEGR